MNSMEATQSQVETKQEVANPVADPEIPDAKRKRPVKFHYEYDPLELEAEVDREVGLSDEEEEEEKYVKAVESLCNYNKGYFDWLENHVFVSMTSNCTCNDCYHMKCKAYEVLRCKLDAEYEKYKAIVAFKRGKNPNCNVDIAKQEMTRKLSNDCFSVSEHNWLREFKDIVDGHFYSLSFLQEKAKPQRKRMEIVELLMKRLLEKEFDFFKYGSDDSQAQYFIDVMKQRGIVLERKYGLNTKSFN